MNNLKQHYYIIIFIIPFLLFTYIIYNSLPYSKASLPSLNLSSNDNIITNFTYAYCAKSYDAILVLAGGTGINPNTPPLWTQRRCKLAVEIHNCVPKRKEAHAKYPMIIPVSAGTAHGAQPLDERGFPIFESAVMARFIHINYHIKPEHVFVCN